MKKDAYYFPHFSNARNDRKLKRVIKELGVEGYGIYFMILEVLRDQTNFKYPMADIDLLADEFFTSEAKIRTVVCNYKLFDLDSEEMFFSPKFDEFMQPYLTMKEQRRLAGIKSGEARRLKALTNPLDEQPFNSRSTTVQRELNENEQSKVKESKVNIYRKFKHLSMTQEEADRIMSDGYTKAQLDNILDSIENYSKNKNYTSLNLTARKWLKKEYGEPQPMQGIDRSNRVEVKLSNM